MADWFPPFWPDAVVLVLGTFRLVRLIGWDDLPAVVRLRGRATGAALTQNLTDAVNGTRIVHRRPVLAHFLACPYCQGFWVGLATWALYLAAGEATLFVLAPFALSAAVGITARILDP